MSWVKDSLTSSVGRKVVMSVTGLFLIGFLVVHLIGNLALLKNDGGASFNEYAHFMKESTLIKIGEVVLFLGFIVHSVQGIIVYKKNKAARPVKYEVGRRSETRSFASNWMGPLGIIILICLMWHLYNFFSYKYTADLMGGIEMMTINGEQIPDLAGVVYRDFAKPWQVAIYMIFMLALSFHLIHGFRSSFQSLGLNHKKYNKMIKYLGIAYAIIVPLAFAMIPILIYIGCGGSGSCSAH